MDDVSCPALGYCVAVGTIGYVEDTGPSTAAAAIETDGVWGPDTVLAPPPNTTSSNLTSVSCPTINVCYALGTDSGGTPYVVEESSGVWGQPQLLAASPDLVAIDCPTAGSCTAVGNNDYSTLNDGAWSSFGLPGIDMTSVSCVDASDCTALGSRLCDRNRRRMGFTDDDQRVPARRRVPQQYQLHEFHGLHGRGL